MKKIIAFLTALKRFLAENWFKLLILGCLLFFLFQLNHLAKIVIYNLGLKQEGGLSQQETRLLESDIFNRKVKCQEMVTTFKARYNNVTGGNYNTASSTCNIEYRTNEGKASMPMDEMSDN